MADAVVIGSGCAGSPVAWELARCGWSVTVLERGRHYRPGFGERSSGELGTLFGSDEVKMTRGFMQPDAVLEPYTTRTKAEAAAGVSHSAKGAYGQLGSAVGGTSLHYNAKFPRFWRQDFHSLSALGPVDGATIADWPITYDDLAPFYDEVEYRVGVQGDMNLMPARTRSQAPRSRQFPMPPNPIPYAAQIAAEGARRLGCQPYPQPAAVNSVDYDGRPACVSCGMCSGFGCPINARGDALTSWLNPAVLTGQVHVIDRAFVHRIDTTADGRRATAVRYLDRDGAEQSISAEIVIVAGSPINTARLLLLSTNGAHPNGLGNRSDQVGRNMMFHNFTLAAGLHPAGNLHANRAQSNGFQLDELMGPFLGPHISALGVPYIKGGLVQLGGGGFSPVAEASLYAGFVGWGLAHKLLMKFGLLRDRAVGSQLVHEDLPQAHNRIDLDPAVKDYRGVPSARITYSPHRHEHVASLVLGAQLQLIHALAPGATGSIVLPLPLVTPGAQSTAHLAGTARMGVDPETSVTDATGRMHELDNVYIADASTFPTFPGFNPSLTIMANALRIARGLTGGCAPDVHAAGGAAAGVPGGPSRDRVAVGTAGSGAATLPATGGGAPLLPIAVTVGAAAAANAARRLAQQGQDP